MPTMSLDEILHYHEAHPFFEYRTVKLPDSLGIENTVAALTELGAYFPEGEKVWIFNPTHKAMMEARRRKAGESMGMNFTKPVIEPCYRRALPDSPQPDSYLYNSVCSDVLHSIEKHPGFEYDEFGGPTQVDVDQPLRVVIQTALRQLTLPRDGWMVNWRRKDGCFKVSHLHAHFHCYRHHRQSD